MKIRRCYIYIYTRIFFTLQSHFRIIPLKKNFPVLCNKIEMERGEKEGIHSMEMERGYPQRLVYTLNTEMTLRVL